MKLARAKNIIISGTNFWNPGDDFVRDGVIRILHEVFSGYTLNFLFYNFNQDFFPQSKFTGISNTVANGDLDQYRDHVDAIVIAGLSAGNEIKDLYHWIISNQLQDRVYLIGAGYENSYVDDNICEEPEATIFRNARIITGRTRKTPDFISEQGLNYHHVNCPAILSVPDVKDVPCDKKIEKIGFSIQLPHGSGVPNHCCTKAIFDLAMSIMFECAKHFQIEMVAHHKTEYFLFLNAFANYDITVRFSSFYQDYHDIYRGYDLVVTTRLHASLYANGHGIPGIIINDTDRHTHCLEGFPHSVWVDSRESFRREFNAFQLMNLEEVSRESANFKRQLLYKYTNLLKNAFGVSDRSQQDLSLDEIKSKFIQELGQTKHKVRVLKLFEKLTADRYLTNNIEYYRQAITKGERWFDNVVVLNWASNALSPASYLEIGVRRGRSLVQVMAESPATKCFGFDLWIQDYSGETNPGPEFVFSELQNAGVLSIPNLIAGDSHDTLPSFLGNLSNPQFFDLILVDGDHSYSGAKFDLALALKHLAPGGLLIFDDIRHVCHPELSILWEEVKQLYPDYLFVEDIAGNGTGLCVKPPFDKIVTALESVSSFKKSTPVETFTSGFLSD
ncbi:MAG TPA: class I SAM-dependent methyltransferase [Deltaproteobacteria bacterium]|nr:class I SAM-dependent methyltransferase [Deltaproteobacteria bacterium]